jgi:hypothetical protein
MDNYTVHFFLNTNSMHPYSEMDLKTLINNTIQWSVPCGGFFSCDNIGVGKKTQIHIYFVLSCD